VLPKKLDTAGGSQPHSSQEAFCLPLAALVPDPASSLPLKGRAGESKDVSENSSEVFA